MKATSSSRNAALARQAAGETCLTCRYSTASYGHVVWCEHHQSFPHFHDSCPCWKLTSAESRNGS